MYNSTSSPQRRPQKAQQPDQSRDSNALRASVLDAALAIGIGSSRVVENWMFNTVEEENEEADFETLISPGLTSASTATSEDSTPSPSTFAAYPPPKSAGEPRKPYFIPQRQPSPNIVFPVPSPQPSPSKHSNKLRKKHKDADGYVTDGATKKAAKAAKKKAAKDAPAESSDEGGGYFSDFGRRKKSRTKKKSIPAVPSVPSPDAGDESDGGYLSEASKKKRGFFRLKSKSSKASALSAAPPAVPPMVPPLPSVQSLPVLPIAGRFVRSPEPFSAASSFELEIERSRSATPLARQGLRAKPSVDSVSTADDPELETPSTSLSGHGHTAQISSENTGPDITSPAKKGVRFTPSTRFSGPATVALDVPASPARPVLVISTLHPLTPTGPRNALAPSPTPSDFTIISSSDYIEPSSGYLIPSPSVAPQPLPDLSAGAYPADSRPSQLRLNVPSPSRARFSLADLPPPTPPPTGPLPDVPPPHDVQAPPTLLSAPQPQAALSFPPPSAYLGGSRSASPVRAPSRNGRASPGLFAQPIPPIQRGRESPFPAKPVLPQEESIELVRRTSLTVRQRRRVPTPTIAIEDEDGQRFLSPSPSGGAVARSPIGRSHSPGLVPRDVSPGVTYDPRERGRAPTVVMPDDDVRSDVALFFFPPTKVPGELDTLSPYHSRIAPESVYEDEPDDASVYPPTAHSRSIVDSYYFASNGADSRPASFIDDERSNEIRTRFVQRVSTMWDAAGWKDEGVPPVPPLPRGVPRGAF